MTRPAIFSAAGVVLLGLLTVPASKVYYESSWGEGCARCHEIQPNLTSWQNSAHRKVNCTACHSSTLLGNMHRVATHAKGDQPERILLKADDVNTMTERCRGCHQQEFAQWKAGPHSTTYAKIFTDHQHNAKRRLMDDCLRCHGMHFEGGIADVVEPIGATGPWRLKDPSLTSRPAIPCLGCHSMHREGAPLAKADRLGKTQEILRPSVGLFDRRSRTNISAAILPVPAMLEADRKVKMSPDQRQSLCYQCHAPLASMQAGSGDDRTPLGVHEGLSCLACHQKHGQWTRQSCADCHPRLSNCGLDVEKMDTTFANTKSRHNVHTVKCRDCHPSGVPPKKLNADSSGRSARAAN